ncbi:MAG: hypothetical protein Q7R50_00530 [Dehalococcoidales bacterium]|nr:hypothetical protein [Dehalococcoidales bacterium]
MKTALKAIGITLGSVVFLVIAAAAIVFFLMHRSPAITSTMTTVNSSHQSVVALDSKITAFNNAVQNAIPGTPVSLNITQQEMTSKVNEELAGLKLPEGLSVGNVTINFQDGKALVSAPIKYSALTGTAGMAINVQTVNGTPMIAVQDIDFGALPIPQALKDQITGMIPNGGKIDLGDIPVDITSIQIIDGQIVMNGVTK